MTFLENVRVIRNDISRMFERISVGKRVQKIV